MNEQQWGKKFWIVKKTIEVEINRHHKRNYPAHMVRILYVVLNIFIDFFMCMKSITKMHPLQIVIYIL